MKKGLEKDEQLVLDFGHVLLRNLIILLYDQRYFRDKLKEKGEALTVVAFQVCGQLFKFRDR